jgi:ribosomal protein S6--L-glutamate ligase|tara:strand:+ start:4876 stop:5937 length:1062 start_codon:yes stop_codon:yes gene_type:complete
MDNFSSFLTEKKGKPYKIVLLVHTGAHTRDVADKAQKTGPSDFQFVKHAKKLGIEIFVADFVGMWTEKKGNKRLIHSFPFDENDQIKLPTADQDKLEYQKPFECSPEDTIIMPRGLGTANFTSNCNWHDMVKEFEMEGYFVMNSLEARDICNSKYLTYLKFLQHNVRTPKTVPVVHSEGAELAFEQLDTKFPIILKASVGTQTGVGVVIIESMRSLRAIIQMLLLYNKYLPIILQEYIKTDYDIRVIVFDGKIIGAMRRNVIADDARSNVSLGAEMEAFEITELEASEAKRIAKITKTKLAGIDFIPAKDRENELPWCLEVNSSVGLGGIEKISKESPTEKVLTALFDRGIWK